MHCFKGQNLHGFREKAIPHLGQALSKVAVLHSVVTDCVEHLAGIRANLDSLFTAFDKLRQLVIDSGDICNRTARLLPCLPRPGVNLHNFFLSFRMA